MISPSWIAGDIARHDLLAPLRNFAIDHELLAPFRDFAIMNCWRPCAISPSIIACWRQVTISPSWIAGAKARFRHHELLAPFRESSNMAVAWDRSVPQFLHHHFNYHQITETHGCGVAAGGLACQSVDCDSFSSDSVWNVMDLPRHIVINIRCDKPCKMQMTSDLWNKPWGTC